MNELKPTARAALQAMGNDDGPSAGERERLRGRIFAALAAGGAASASHAASGAESAAVARSAAQGTLKSALVSSKFGSLGSVAFGLTVGGLVGCTIALSAPLFFEKEAPAPSAVASLGSVRSQNPKSSRPSVIARSDAQTSEASDSSGVNESAVEPSANSPQRGTPSVDTRASRTLDRVPQQSGETPHGEALTFGTDSATRPPEIRQELALLEQAHRELSRGNATASLSVLDEHARRFPNGAFSAERTAARVFALCALGQLERARAIGSEFLRLQPDSPLVPRIRSSCAVSR